eukprot:Nk52_evm58s152 gene=Nk52_evmTU58s152
MTLKVALVVLCSFLIASICSAQPVSSDIKDIVNAEMSLLPNIQGNTTTETKPHPEALQGGQKLRGLITEYMSRPGCKLFLSWDRGKLTRCLALLSKKTTCYFQIENETNECPSNMNRAKVNVEVTKHLGGRYKYKLTNMPKIPRSFEFELKLEETSHGWTAKVNMLKGFEFTVRPVMDK